MRDTNLTRTIHNPTFCIHHHSQLSWLLITRFVVDLDCYRWSGFKNSILSSLYFVVCKPIWMNSLWKNLSSNLAFTWGGAIGQVNIAYFGVYRWWYAIGLCTNENLYTGATSTFYFLFHRQWWCRPFLLSQDDLLLDEHHLFKLINVIHKQPFDPKIL